MADNTGSYITYGQVLLQLAIAGDSSVTKATTVLSNKTVNAGGDIYDFVGGSPLVGDVVSQSGRTASIIALPVSTKLQISVTGASNPIVNGNAQILHSDTVLKAQTDDEIKTWSDFMDLQTRWWFNARAKTIRLEGRNSNVLLLPVPIISISEIKLNGDTVGTDLSLFTIFSNRDGIPDDRRNPRIKILSNSQNIFIGRSGRTFHRGAITEMTGVWGFLESNGSTPMLIQRAVTKLVLNAIKNNMVSQVASASTGAKKAERVDLHETEYFQPDDVRGAPSGAISGDIEVDRIITMYRGPMGIGGSILDTPTVEEFEQEDMEW